MLQSTKEFVSSRKFEKAHSFYLKVRFGQIQLPLFQIQSHSNVTLDFQTWYIILNVITALLYVFQFEYANWYATIVEYWQQYGQFPIKSAHDIFLMYYLI